MLCVNMQTSFMHPPFGFALFYLRSVAPAKEYTDRLTKKIIPPVTTMQIYWGAVPFVLIQIVMVGLIIFFPGIVSSGLDKEEKIDLDKVQMQMENDTSTQPNQPAASGPQAEAPAAAASGSGLEPPPAPSSDADEQKKIDDLFKK